MGWRRKSFPDSSLTTLITALMPRARRSKTPLTSPPEINETHFYNLIQGLAYLHKYTKFCIRMRMSHVNFNINESSWSTRWMGELIKRTTEQKIVQTYFYGYYPPHYIYVGISVTVCELQRLYLYLLAIFHNCPYTNTEFCIQICKLMRNSAL